MQKSQKLTVHTDTKYTIFYSYFICSLKYSFHDKEEQLSPLGGIDTVIDQVSNMNSDPFLNILTQEENCPGTVTLVDIKKYYIWATHPMYRMCAFVFGLFS